MTTAFAALLLGVAGAALLLALAAYLWVNRTPSTGERFDEYGRVPLFGVDLTGAPTSGGSEPTDFMNAAALNRFSRTSAASDAVRERTTGFRRTALADSETVTSANGTGAPIPPIDGVTEPPADIPDGNAQVSDKRTPNARYHPDARGVDIPPSNGQGLSAEQFDKHPDLTPPMGEQRPARSTSWGATPGWPSPRDNGNGAVPGSRPIPTSRPASPAYTPTSNGNGVTADGVPGSMIEGHQFRFSTPMEGTLQFLPGRLEISSGLDAGREIRFVRVPGPNGTEVTFGRNEGPLYRHIQLRDQTVSREHAQLLFAAGQWTLTNLSRTNPVAHNGRILRLAEQQMLSDGDRLEMGEVVFSFRSR